MSKGSSPRPLAVPQQQFGATYEGIFGAKVRPRWKYAPACECVAGKCKAWDARSCADWAKRELKGNADGQ